MNDRHLIELFAIVMFGIVIGMGADYELIGNGGFNVVDLKVNTSIEENESRYEIFMGRPADPTDFDDGETLKGHVFSFQGQVMVGDYPIWFDQATIIVEDLCNVTCQQKYSESFTCNVSSGYLVDRHGNLHLIKDLKLLPNTDASAWQYLGTGHLTRVQRVFLKNDPSNITKESPDPGKYRVTWSGVEPRSVAKAEPEAISKTAIAVDKWILSETNDSVKFNIVVSNVGSTRLDTVRIIDIMPEGLNYTKGNSSVISFREITGIAGKITDPIKGTQVVIEEAKEDAATPIEPILILSRNDTDSTKSPWNLTYNIGPIETGDAKYLYINAIKLSLDVDVKENSIYAEGTWSAGNETDSDTDKASYQK